MIRPLKLSDSTAIKKIIDEYTAMSSLGVPNWSLQQIQAECEAGGLGFDDHVGLAAFILFRSSVGNSEITYLATRIDAVQNGLMSALLKHMAAHRSKGEEIWLEVHSGNLSARKLYGKIGFKTVGERPRYYADGASAILFTLGDKSS
jgi:ribosomal-protein-alanine N-acetyltransferase